MQIDALGTAAVQASGPSAPMTGASPWPTHMGGTLDGIASLLGTSSDALRSQLRGGSSLASIAEAKGVSRSDLVSSIEKLVQDRRASDGLAPVDGSTLDAIASRAVDRTGRGGHHRHAAVAGAASAAQQAAGDPDGDGDVDGTGADVDVRV